MRKNRVWYQGAIYHVMNRGINHMRIYRDESDYQFFLVLMKRTLKKYSCILHCYCLMTNHYHILLETQKEEIWKIMKEIGQYYAEYFNKKYNRDGAVFRGRYNASLVENDEYFLETNRYITLNPVKAGIVKKPEQYKWCSYRTYLGLQNDQITQKGKTLNYFKNSDIKLYQQFVEEKVSHFDYEHFIQKEMKEDDLWLPW